MANTTEALGREWRTLQDNYEQYEREALRLKLLSVLLITIGLALHWSTILLAAVVALLWLQEGIWRTGQSRLGRRIVQLETQLKAGEANPGHAFQLHSEWQATRPSCLGLLAEYASNACRPTVAYPHALLGLLILFVN